MASPIVALFCKPETAIEEQPAVDREEQVGPVKELTHKHLHVSSPVGKACPPFSQVTFAAHLFEVAAWVPARSDCADGAESFFWFGMTISTTGMTAAAATSATRSKSKVMNSQSGMPQQRRCFRLRI